LEHVSTGMNVLGGVNILPGNVDRHFLHNGWGGGFHATEELLKKSPGQQIQNQISVTIARQTFVLIATEWLFL
jgi:hypothetical protein